MHNERCTSGSGGGPEKPIGRKADRALRSDPTVSESGAAAWKGAGVQRPWTFPRSGGRVWTRRRGVAGLPGEERMAAIRRQGGRRRAAGHWRKIFFHTYQH